MARKTRSDIQVGNLEKKLGVKPGTIRNPNGTDARSDKKLGTLRAESAKVTTTKKTTTASARTTRPKSSATTSTGTTRPKSSTTAIQKKVATPVKRTGLTAVTADQKKASIRTVKHNPKASSSVVRRVRKAITKKK